MDSPSPPNLVLAAPAEAIPDAAKFTSIVLPSAPRNRAARQLLGLLTAIDMDKPLEEREVMLIRITTWVRKGPSVPAPEGAPDVEAAATRRLRVLLAGLEAVPALRANLAALVGSVLSEQSAEGFFAKTGIPGDQGLMPETVNRLAARLLPEPLDEQDLTQLVARMFPHRRDPEWLVTIPPELVLRLSEHLRQAPNPRTGSVADMTRSTHPDAPLGTVSSIPPGPESGPGRRSNNWSPLRMALLDAILLLAARVSAAGLRDAIRVRSGIPSLRDSPFFRLPRGVDALLATPRSDLEEATAWADACRGLVRECREASASVFGHLEQAGVSVDVVYRLELIERSLRRIELLLDLLVAQPPEERAARSTRLLATLLDERRRDLSLTDIVRTNTRLLARKVIERAGETGEHYITVTRGEYFKMFLSAGGGGLLTGLTTLIKFLIGSLHRPPLQEGLLAGMNYAGSFLLMQFLGFTLATKQPGMTAAALAGSIKQGSGDFAALVNTVARVIRSQLAAAAGNVLMVIPAGLAVSIGWLHYRGELLLDAAYAEKVAASFHPTESGTIPFAALTGVILWLSSLCAGWLENWAVYRRLPEAIAEHRIRRWIGHGATSWASRVFARNISGIGGNISVGFMLGMTASIGQFVGIPLDVRHVTLSTGQLTVAAYTLGPEFLQTPAFRWAVAGIGIILVMNLTVSFGFAIVVALRAREVSFYDALRLFFAIIGGFIRSPLRFFLPVEKVAEGAHGHGH